MKYQNFEDLPVWKAAIEFALAVFDFTNRTARIFAGLGDTRNQLERAVVSISNNTAEGFERGTTKELINYLYIAKGSAGESRSVLCLCEQVPRFAANVEEIRALKERARNISAQLNGWITSLQKTSIKGPKFLHEDRRQL